MQVTVARFDAAARDAALLAVHELLASVHREAMTNAHTHPVRTLSGRWLAAVLGWAAIAVVVLGAGYEALVATGVIGLGGEPGGGPPGDTIVMVSAITALLTGAATLAVCACIPVAAARITRAQIALFAPACPLRRRAPLITA
jgi:hypothetical protein